MGVRPLRAHNRTSRIAALGSHVGAWLGFLVLGARHGVRPDTVSKAGASRGVISDALRTTLMLETTALVPRVRLVLSDCALRF